MSTTRLDLLKDFIVPTSENIRSIIKIMDERNTGFIVLIDAEERVAGVITEGDIRRAILHGLDMRDPALTIANKKFKYLNYRFATSEAVQLFKDDSICHLPVLDNGQLKDIIARSEFTADEKEKKLIDRVSNLFVVIMAGGKGTRLDPFTRILPKPLIPVGNEPVIKVIMNEFGKFGIKNFFVTLQDKAKMIKAYFHEHESDCRLQYIEEKMPLGTAGALKFLQDEIDSPFFVSNCDIIIQTDYVSVFDFHKKGEYDLTLVGSMQQYTIPYGVCEIEHGGELVDLREKPEYDFLVNTGFYLLEPKVLKYIPENKYFDMTDLIKRLQSEGLKVGVYPVSKNSWIDVGQWADYKSMMDKLNII